MLRVFGHHIAIPTLLIALLETGVFLAVLYAVAAGRAVMDGAAGGATASAITAPAMEPAALVSLAAVAFVLIAAVGMYSRPMFFDLRTTLRRSLIALPLIVAALTAFAFTWASATQADPENYAAITLLGAPAAALTVLALRALFLETMNLDAFRRRVLVLGVGPHAARMGRLMRQHDQRHFTIVGFVNLSDQNGDAVTGGVAPIFPRTVIANRHRLRQLCQELAVDEIVFAGRERRRGDNADGGFGLPVWDLLECRLTGRQVSSYDAFWEREAAQIDLDALKPGWLVFSDGFRFSPVRRFVKRGFDITVSFLLLLLTLPITLTTAALIKLTSPGPVFFTQERVGLEGRVFKLYKFRSMGTDAEKNGAVWAQKNDVRVTPVGRVIRKTRIDEIPQAINVLRGDMSFIGPRPERPEFVSDLQRHIPYYGERHAVRPGISGWAQINYPYGASIEDARRKLAYDLYYIKNGSTFLDILILVQTVKVVLFPDGFAR